MFDKREYLKSGFFTIKNFFKPEEMSYLKIVLDEISTDYSDMVQPHKEAPYIRNLIFNEELNVMLLDLFDGEYDAIQTQLRFKPPGSEGFPLHQDDFWTSAGWNNTVNILVHVDDADEENGCIFVYPKSHKPPFFSEKVNLIASSGDITFLHNYVLHGSDINNTTEFRRNLLMMYSRKGCKFSPGESAKREIIFKHWT